MVNPTILTTTQQYQGRRNLNLEEERLRLELSRSYEDLSTICIIPHSGTFPAQVVQNWLNLVKPMNQKFLPLMVKGNDKNAVYNSAISEILSNPILSSSKYILTMEENIVPPFDGLLKLYEHIDKFDVVGGLIWQPGIEKIHAMVYGHPHSVPADFLPIPVETDRIIPCRGLSTGFTLFKLDLFKNTKFPSPWFRPKSFSEVRRGKNIIPDMYFFEIIARLGYKAACDTRVKAGNYDAAENLVW